MPWLPLGLRRHADMHAVARFRVSIDLLSDLNSPTMAESSGILRKEQKRGEVRECPHAWDGHASHATRRSTTP